VADQHAEQIEQAFGVRVTVPSLPFPRVSLAAAREMVSDSGHRAPDGQVDLDPAGERALSAAVLEREGHEFVFVTDYPIAVRPFYHMRYEQDPNLTKSFDLLWRGIELTTGAQREHRHARLVSQAQQKGVDTESISYYLDFFRFGCPPHGGFGFGLTRLLMQLLGQDNVREVTFLYRGPHRLSP
jgi:aspartyl-tRNA synthetase